MQIKRRHFLKLSLGTLLASQLTLPSLSLSASKHRIKALACDAFPIFDPRPIFALVRKLYPEQGDSLSNLWRTRQFEYQWQRALANQYQDFWQATEDGLEFAAKSLNINLTAANKQQLMNAYLNLQPWPDVVDSLTKLKEMGIKVGFLSNMTKKMLQTNVKNSALDDLISFIISTDEGKTFKPSPNAYQLGIDNLGYKKNEILFVAFAGWDVAGAKWFGYPTYWVNRTGALPEELGVRADGESKQLTQLVEFVAKKNRHKT